MPYTLVADVGGTTAKIALAKIKSNKPILSNMQLIPTNIIISFEKTLIAYLKQHNKSKDDISCISIGAAGIVQGNKTALANNKLIIDADKIKKATRIKNIVLINDFEALSSGIQYLTEKDLVVVSKGEPIINSTKAVIGAGTGLGKAMLIYDSHISVQSYRSLPSEGGHCDVPCQTEQDQQLLHFLRLRLKRNDNYAVSYEEILSGRGLQCLYEFVYQEYFSKEKNNNSIPSTLSPEQIMTTKKQNPCSAKTVTLFVYYYARCCRNFALEVMPRSGLYIAGGIAMNNADVFRSHDEFVKEFYQHSHPHYAAFLKQIPLFIVTNKHVSLLGAAVLGSKERE